MPTMTPSEREVLRKTINNSIVNVTFTKSNGDLRTLRCTTNGALIFAAGDEPPVANNSVKSRVHSSGEALAVWDLENKGWRSFRYDSILYTVQEPSSSPK